MKAQFSIFLRYFYSSARDLAPIIIVIVFFQLVVLQEPIPNIGQLLVSVLLVMLGLTFFISGLEMGLFPIGEAASDGMIEQTEHAMVN